MRRFFFILCSLVFIGNINAGEELKFTASAPDTAVIGRDFKITFEINTDNKSNPFLPEMKSFDLLFGPTTNTFRKMVSGKSKVEKKYIYAFQPKEEGTFRIPGAVIETEIGKLTSNEIIITVVTPDKAPPTPVKLGRGPITDEELFMQVIASKTRVYHREMIRVTYKVYSQIELQSLFWVSFPDITGFALQDAKIPGKMVEEQYNGRTYKTYIFEETLLYPQQTGRLTIGSATFEATALRKNSSGNIFDDFLTDNSSIASVKKTLTTPKIQIQVDPLPPGSITGFSGAVGTFRINSAISNPEVNVKEAITVRITVSGEGNLQHFTIPNLIVPENCELIEVFEQHNLKRTREAVGQNRIIDYKIIPNKEGNYTLPGIQFSYFDPKDKVYKVLSTQEYDIKVLNK